MLKFNRVAICALLVQSAVTFSVTAQQDPLVPLPDKTEHPLIMKSEDIPGKEKEIATWFKANQPGFDLERPAGQALVWFYARWSRPGKAEGSPTRIFAKYYNISTEFYNNTLKVREALEAKGFDRSLVDAWERYYAFRWIQMRMPIPAEPVLKLINGLPEGEIQQVDSVAAFQSIFEKTYPGYAALDGRVKLQWMRAFAHINPDLSEESFYRDQGEASPKKDMIQVTSSMKDGWKQTTLFALTEPQSTLLFPRELWLKSNAKLFDPGPADENSATVAQARKIRVAMKEAGVHGEDYVLVASVSEDRVLNAYLTRPDLNNRQFPVIPLGGPRKVTGNDEVWLSWNGYQLTGNAVIINGKDLPNAKRPARLLFSINATVKDTAVTGNFQTWVFDERRRKRHEKTGQVAAMPSSDFAGIEVNTSKSWTQFMGPEGTGVAADSGQALVKNLEDARLLWVSDQTIPTGRGPDTRGRARATPFGHPLMGGWASPMVADGKVILFYYEPSGKHLANGAKLGETTHGLPLYRRNFILADDVVHCFDLKTGKTLWKRVYEGRGVNWAGFNKGGPMLSPAIADGKVYAMTTSGEIYALDLETGRTLWRNDIGPRHELTMAERPQLIAEKINYTTRNDFQINVIVSNGVVIVGDGRFTKRNYRYELQNGLIAFDAKTGVQRWALPEVAGSNRFLQSAQLIKADGKEYLLAAANDGVRLIEPATGRVIDHAKDMLLRHTNLAVGDGIVLGDGGKETREQPNPGLLAYRVSAEGFQPAWKLPEKYGRMQGGGTYVDGRFYLMLHSPRQMVLCVDAKTGEVLDEANVRIAGGEHCPFIISMGDYVFACTDRTAGLIMLDADPATFAKSGRDFRLSLATGYCGSILPALVDGLLIIRQPDRLVCYDLRASSAPQRKLAEHWPRPSAQSSLPQPKKGKVEKKSPVKAKSPTPDKTSKSKDKKKKKSKPQPSKEEIEKAKLEEKFDQILE